MNSRESRRRTRQFLAVGLLALLVLTPGAALADEPPAEPDTEPTESEEVEKPEVITNKHLEKYGEGDPRRNEWRPPPPEPPPPPAAVVPRKPVPPEDRPGTTTRLEMETRQAELEALLQFLEAKMAWMKNPFLRRPTPPDDESIVNPSQSTSQQFAETRERAEATRLRLDRVREWLRDNPGAYEKRAGSPVP